MLETDEIILNLLLDEKKKGNPLLKNFHIQYPSKKVAEDSNNIFVACVSSENNIDGFDFSTFTDLVEILIVTKQKDYKKAIAIIKTISKEICKIIMKNIEKFPNKPTIRNINPEFNNDFILTRGHIMVQCKTEAVDFDISEDIVTDVCIFLSDDYIDVE